MNAHLNPQTRSEPEMNKQEHVVLELTLLSIFHKILLSLQAVVLRMHAWKLSLWSSVHLCTIYTFPILSIVGPEQSVISSKVTWPSVGIRTSNFKAFISPQSLEDYLHYLFGRDQRCLMQMCFIHLAFISCNLCCSEYTCSHSTDS